MSRFVSRDKSNAVVATFAVRQWDGQEELPDDAPEVVEFKALQDAKIVAAMDRGKALEARISALEKKGA